MSVARVDLGYSQTNTGPLGPADRDILSRVKQAGLWEMPIGVNVRTSAQSPRLREIAALIVNEHHDLNSQTDAVAGRLGVQLPDEPTTEQEAWIAEINATSSDEYDSLAVRRLREAHGNILPLLAQVHAGTRNDEIRRFTAVGLTYVTRHISYLESTGLVNHAELPEPPQPKPLLSPIKAAYYDLADKPTLIFSVVVIALCGLGSIYIVYALIKSGRKRK